MNAVQQRAYEIFRDIGLAADVAARGAVDAEGDYFERAKAAADAAFKGARRFYREAGLTEPLDTREEQALKRLVGHRRAVSYQTAGDVQLAVNDAIAILEGKPATAGERVRIVHCTGRGFQPDESGGHDTQGGAGEHDGDDGRLLYWQHDGNARVSLDRGGECSAVEVLKLP